MAFSLNHVHIKSHDPRASAMLWIDMFGGTILPEVEFKSMLFSPVEFGGVRLNNTTPGPGEADIIHNPPKMPYLGLEHIGLETDDLDAILSRFEEQGLNIYERRAGPGGFEIAFAETPDRVVVELLEQTG